MLSKLNYTELNAILNITASILQDIQSKRLLKRDNFLMENEKVRAIQLRNKVISEFNTRIDSLLSETPKKRVKNNKKIDKK